MSARVPLLLALAGCAPEPGPVDPQPPAPEQGGFDDVDDAPLVDEGLPGRDWRRMDVDQLAASIERVTGHRWRDEAGQDRFEQLHDTLGVADYQLRVTEELEPTLIFQRFLEVAALDTCGLLVTDEIARGPDERVFLTHVAPDATWDSDPAGVEATLIDALLRFHGRPVAPGSPDLEAWTFLVRTLSTVSPEPHARWRAVCVALVTHPDFYTY